MPTPPPSNHLLRVAVYGTLRQGHSNHVRFCTGFSAVQEIEIRGRVGELRPGIPILSIPLRFNLADGTADATSDLQTQKEIAATVDGSEEWTERFEQAGNWNRIPGELFYFADASRRLPPLDGLEGFRPGRNSLYHRVLAPVMTEAGIRVAWLYVDGATSTADD
ncbi:gamma-glutamylcyclotransferase [bacterium]|nr:gamma-glutamylcyclotransferase [bacterium]